MTREDEKLLRTLLEVISKRYAEDAELLLALEEVRKRYDEGTADWRYALLRTIREYLRSIGVDHRLIDPVQIMMFESADNIVMEQRRAEGLTGTPKPPSEVAPIAYAAAAVTTLKDRHKMKLEDAIAAVAKASGIRRSDLSNYRDNISRNRAPAAARVAYDITTKEHREHQYSPDDVLNACAGIRRGKYVG